ncbi:MULTISPECIES: succinate dehydrogenase, cytochrome b556 subunit [unclassified Massilia]|uniref:succinate dehydrogenase, cytochrome b556 subunit n=1 Tax=unclassified Massilia TaxID=2609279 RepID=UPI001B841AE1|nr:MULTISPECIES: succinate dehydrogenase, cytochrome b556 subunit [unclassified Massilia]MBQ5939233.1 succinate dehydrogenase, cytochrome b556 subunit [Massilia sp. AB1]MBQ5965588.1 succinate dehydrogenase, cytochrome b556 subunit [Massilia sp. ZL223]
MSEAVREAAKKGRPEFRNIGISDITGKYRMPPSAIVSILHRISGAGLFLMLPFLLYLLQESLLSETSFEHFRGIMSNVFVKIILLGLSWAYLHHFTAGVRHLFMDNHLALDKDAAQKTARWVLVVSLALTVLVGLKLFGVF